MIVAVDARALAAAPRGVARYTRELVGALAAAHPGDEYRLVVPGRRAVDAPSAANVTLVRPHPPGRVVHGVAAIARRPRLARLAGRDVRVAWLPAPAPAAVGDVPYVVTVHDLSWEERPADFTAYERAWHALARPRALARRAAAVVADAAPTRAALLERWRLDPARVHVVRPGVPAPAAPRGPNRFGRYVLYVGALEPRKAPELLLGAFARARARGLDADLVVAGTGRRARALAGRPGVHLLGAVSDAELDALYDHALAVVLPSWLEGYGLPPLEALARGTPAIVADLAVYDGTLGGAALRFAPGDAAALADALVRVEGERDRLLAAAPPLPSWVEAARALHAILAEATDPGRRVAVA